MKPFIALAGVHSLAFFIVTIQLLLAKPTSMKVLIPLILITTSAFFLLISIDFYIEYHLLHVTPKLQYTKSDDAPSDKESKKKKGKGFKLGFLVIYINMCLVTWFLYLAFKDLEEEIESQEYEDEPNNINSNNNMEIIISHIT